MKDTQHGGRRTTRAEDIRQHLADDIVRGRLAPGIQLDEVEIARKFGVSRTPVREAIRQLEVTGLVEARPHRGAVVATVTKERLAEMFQVMLELEGLCARLSAIAMTAAERGALLDLQAAGEAHVNAGDIEAYYRHNLAFHDAIYRGAHNTYLTELTLSVRKRLAPFRRAQFSGTGRLLASHAEHGRVLAAITREDGEGAATAMRDHIQTVRDAYVLLVPQYGAAWA